MEIVGNTIMFYGHQVFPMGLVWDVLTPSLAFIFLIYYLKAQNAGNKKGMYLWEYIWLLTLPNATYLFFEFRHVLIQDGVADGKEPEAILGFGLISILGLVLTVVQIYLTTTRMSPFTKHPRFSGILLSCACTWGAILGIHELVSMTGVIFPPSILVVSAYALSLESIALTLVMGSLISVLVLLLLKKMHY